MHNKTRYVVILVYICFIATAICNSVQLNQIKNDKQELTLSAYEVASEEIMDQIDEETLHYTSFGGDNNANVDADTAICTSTDSNKCHPSRKCNMFCNCNIEMEDGFVFNMAVVTDFVFTITQKSLIWPTEYEYNVTFCRNNVVYDRNKCSLAASITQYETANYPTSTPRCFNIGYWIHDDNDINMKGIADNEGFSFVLHGDYCDKSEKERITTPS